MVETEQHVVLGRIDGLDALFRPRSVAVVGASGRPGNPFARPLENLVRYGFTGPVYPVNPRYEELQGLPCFPSLEDVPGPVDLALLLVPAAETVGVVRRCGDLGVRAAVLFASGFAETAGHGQALQHELATAARNSGTRLLGPNCQGVVSPQARLAATFTGAVTHALPVASPVAYVGQSGALGGSILDLARESGMGLSAWVSTGNQVDVDLVEVGDHLIDREDVHVLAMYLESAVDGPRYTSLARRARGLGKHLVVLRSGRSSAGRRAAASHTGAMVPTGLAFDLVSEAEGVAVVDDVDELLRTAYALSALPLPRGRRASVVTTSGGAGSLVADHLEAQGLVVEDLPAADQAELARLVPAFGATANPVDVTAQLFSGSEHAFADVCRLVAASPATDALVVLLTMVIGEAGQRLAEDLVELARSIDQPLLVAWLAGDEQTIGGRQVYRDQRLPLFRSVGDAARTLALVAGLADRLRAPQPSPVAPDLLGLPGTRRLVELLPGSVVTEWEGGAFLDAVGVAHPAGRLVQTAAEAEQAARALGVPVALKVQSPVMTHKTDQGGLRLSVAPGDARDAYDDLVQGFDATQLQGVLVQPMASPGHELLVGLTASDHGFPPVVTVGFGGVAAEVDRDVVSSLAPVSRAQALDMLRRLRRAPLLFGHRGRPPVDAEAAAEAISRLSVAGAALDGRLGELEINPLIVHPQGQGATAVDFVFRAAGLDRATDHQGVTSG